jgi:hypothetical protein
MKIKMAADQGVVSMELPRLLRTGGTNQEPSRSALVATCVIFATPQNSFWAATMGDKFSIPMLRLYHSQFGGVS